MGAARPSLRRFGLAPARPNDHSLGSRAAILVVALDRAAVNGRSFAMELQGSLAVLRSALTLSQLSPLQSSRCLSGVHVLPQGAGLEAFLVGAFFAAGGLANLMKSAQEIFCPFARVVLP
jgi:hypothetical protein